MSADVSFKIAWNGRYQMPDLSRQGDRGALAALLFMAREFQTSLNLFSRLRPMPTVAAPESDLDFNEARLFVRSLKLRSVDEWVAAAFKDNLPRFATAEASSVLEALKRFVAAAGDSQIRAWFCSKSPLAARHFCLRSRAPSHSSNPRIRARASMTSWAQDNH